MDQDMQTSPVTPTAEFIEEVDTDTMQDDDSL